MAMARMTCAPWLIMISSNFPTLLNMRSSQSSAGWIFGISLVPDGSRDGRDPDLLIEVLKRVNFIVRVVILAHPLAVLLGSFVFHARTSTILMSDDNGGRRAWQKWAINRPFA
jgi:hypothetical protein